MDINYLSYLARLAPSILWYMSLQWAISGSAGLEHGRHLYRGYSMHSRHYTSVYWMILM
jgi:hypothetical protein